jgi:membrane peptidoglycan carboxypeptidase
LTPRQRSRRNLRAWRKRGRTDLRRMLLLGFVVVFVLTAMAVPAVAAQTVGPLPTVQGLSASGLDQDTLIFDQSGQLLADIGASGDHRIVVPLSYISPVLVKATLDIEDHTFYQNSGIDLGGILRATWANLTHRRITQGGSTISQQLVKQVFIGPNPAATLQRKLKEGILALQLNQRYTKNQILELYLNTIYYGEQTYGVESAARSYFQTSAHDLTLAQAAMLAGLPQAPTKNDPVHDPQQAKLRQHEVLQAMVEQRDITQAEADKAFAEKVTVYPPINKFKAPHFVDYVLQTLQKDFHISPNDRKGYRVFTTLRMDLQGIAEGAIHDQIASVGNYYNFHDAALVSMDPRNGEVLAMVGGDDYNRPGGQINMAVSPRQPGSSFKIFTYTAAIESGRLNMTTPVKDEALVFPLGGGQTGREQYTPQNYDGTYHGTLPVKMVMGNSLNIPALKVEMKVGVPSVLSAARRLGISCWGVSGNPRDCQERADDQFSISLTLGGYGVRVLDMATGVSTLATLGVRHQPTVILKIQDGLGRVKYTYDPSTNEYRAVTPQVAYIIGSIMSDDRNRCMSFGCHGDLTLPGRRVAAKTGTTQDFRDNWTVGFTPRLATAVWIGNPNNAPLSHNSTGIIGAAPIWHRYMMEALGGVPDEWYPVPAGLDRHGSDYYLPGTEGASPNLDKDWPRCPFTTFNKWTLAWSDTIVDGVYCVINPLPPPPPPPDVCPTDVQPILCQNLPPLPGATPAPSPTPQPHG